MARNRFDFQGEGFLAQVVDVEQSPVGEILRVRQVQGAVHSIYSDFRDELSSDLQEAQKAGAGHKKRRAALQARLSTMPEEPEDSVEAWLLPMTSREFDEWVSPEIEKWFESPPDWAFEDDYLPQGGTAQGAAMEYFQSMDADDLEILGVTVVEGEHPGSTYYAAELHGDIDEANRAAGEAGIPVRFVAATAS